MLFKNLLVGVGSAGVIGVGGYGIYSATRSSGEDAKDIEEAANSDSDRGSSSIPSIDQGGSNLLPDGSDETANVGQDAAGSKGGQRLDGENRDTAGSSTTSSGERSSSLEGTILGGGVGEEQFGKK